MTDERSHRRVPEEVDVFVSFSVTGDQHGRAFVRLLLTRLAAQPGLRVWIYESPQGRVASGESITNECRKRIEHSHAFVLLVTDQALRSDFVAMEISHALWVRQQRSCLKIYPLLAATTARDAWPLSFREATSFCGRPTQLQSEEVDAIVWDLCIGLGVPFLPGTDHDARLPLRGRIVHELEAVRSERRYDIGDFERLLCRCDQAAKCLAAGDADRALRFAESMLLDCESDYGGFRPYYLEIFRATCKLAEANDCPAKYIGAFEAFDQVIRNWGQRADANAYAGRGHARLRLGEYLEALADYDVAERLLDRPDAALLYSQLRARILAQSPIQAEWLEQLEGMLTAGTVGQQLGDGSRVAAVVALAHAYSGRVACVERVWGFVVDANAADVAVICEVCHWLECTPQTQAINAALQLSTRILEERLANSDATPMRDKVRLGHQLARTEFRSGRVFAARRRIAALLDQAPKSIVLAVDAAMFALEDADHAEASRRCKQAIAIVDPAQCDPPLDRVSYEHAIGQAYWLLGCENESRECHRRAGMAADWFDTNIPELLGAATLAARAQSPLQIV